jgi:septal ring factor EnvC (AmiA/AmiB activator)
MLNQQQQQQLDEQLQSQREEVERLRLQLLEQVQRLRCIEKEKDDLVIQMQELKDDADKEQQAFESNEDNYADMRLHIQQHLLVPHQDSEHVSPLSVMRQAGASRSMSKQFQRMSPLPLLADML